MTAESPIRSDRDERNVAIGVVRSESTQVVKALAREMRGSAQLWGVGLMAEMLVMVRPRAGCRDGGAPCNTSYQALLDYASSSHGEVLTAPHQEERSSGAR
jgi:hypothetical protein